MAAPAEDALVLLPAIRNFLSENEAPKTAKALRKAVDEAFPELFPWDLPGLPALADMAKAENAAACTSSATLKAHCAKYFADLAACSTTAAAAGLACADALKKIQKSLKKEGGVPSDAKSGLKQFYAAFATQAAGGDKKSKKDKKSSKKRDRDEDAAPGEKKSKKAKKDKKSKKAVPEETAEEKKAREEAAAKEAKEYEEKVLNWKPKDSNDDLSKRKKKTVEERKAEKIDPIEAREQNRRQDWGSWAKTLEGKDERLQNGFLRTGDSWGDGAFADLSVVKGKKFVKEMQKKKRASWRGGGALDQGVNSFKFDSDSD